MKLSELAAHTGGNVIGDAESEITGLADIRAARKGEITFLANRKYAEYLKSTEASAVVVADEFRDSETSAALLVCTNPSAAFAEITQLFVPEEAEYKPGISETAVIADSADVEQSAYAGPLVHVGEGSRIGARTVLMPGSYIGRNVTVGEDCLVYPNTTVLDRTVIGSGVIIHSGTVIGSDGFGYDSETGRHVKIRQAGNVCIADDVEIGSCVTVDRARFGSTVIGRGTKVDNLVQIAHNVRIGEDCLIVAQTGLSGSTVIGNHVIFAGRSGSHGHITVHDGAIITGQAVATKDIPAGQMYSGYPARPAAEHRKSEAVRMKLPELLKRIKELEKKVKDL